VSRKNFILAGLLILFFNTLMAKDPISWVLNQPFPNPVFITGDYNVQYTLRNELPFTLVNPLNITKNASSTEFRFNDQCTGMKLRPGDTCFIGITLNPATSGTKTVSLIIGGYDKNQVPLPALTTSSIINPALNYTVGGSTNGLKGTLVLQNNGSDTVTLTSDGTFTFPDSLPPGSAYSVTVLSKPANQTCTVDNGNGIISNANVTNVQVICSVNAYTVGGTLSGLAPQATVELQNNGGEILSLSANGSFVFLTPVAQDALYAVRVFSQPFNQICTVMNGEGTMGSTNVTNVIVLCSTNAYTLGGTLSGLSPTETVVLDDGLGDTLSLNSNGSFTFPNLITQGAMYNVTVSQQPSTQKCQVANGSGTMERAVTNVVVTCVNNNTTLETNIFLALSVTGHTEFGVNGTPSSGLPRIITIQNTGVSQANNLSISYQGLPFGTAHSSTCGSNLAGNASCTITITPGATATSNGTNPCNLGTAPIPGDVSISADNASTVSTNVVVLDYGCIYEGGYIFAFDDTTANTGSVGGKVATTSDQAAPYPNGIVWSSNGGTGGGNQGTDPVDVSFDIIPGIVETSSSSIGLPTYLLFTSFFSDTYTNTNPFTSASFSMCYGALDGFCNTGNILTFYNEFTTHNRLGNGGTPKFTATSGPTTITYYAAGLCAQMISHYSDWYLPAICEMGYGIGVCGNSSTPTLQNMQSSLVDSLSLFAGHYWSSTEVSAIPQLGDTAWLQFFGTGGLTIQSSQNKYFQLGVRCARALTL
jgi:hypothetical protein